MPENMKISSLSQEVVRRMVNTGEMVCQADRNEILEKYISKLEISGYSKFQTSRILVAGLKGYEAKLSRARKEGRDIHIEARKSLAARARKKLTEKENWFK